MKLLYSFLKDLKLSFKGFNFYMEIIFALIFAGVMLFAVPEESKSSMTIYAHTDLDDIHKTIAERSVESEGGKITWYDSREEVVKALNKKRGAIGIDMTMGKDKPEYEYILQGYESEKMRNIIKASLETEIAAKLPEFRDSTEVVALTDNAERLNARMNILPIFLAMNAAFMGLYIIASYIFLDKLEGTIKAFAVTPAKVWHYLLGKLGVLLVSGLISGLIAAILVAGPKANYLHMIILLMATNAFGSALGLLIAGFAETMTQAMGWLYLVIIVLAFASISYFMPAFSPLLIRLLPSYPMIFAFRETMLDAPNVGYIYLNAAGFAAGAALLFVLANIRFKRTLTA